MELIQLNSIYLPSEDIVAREIEGELIIVPLTAGFGDLEDELYTFNETGKAIWNLLDGQRDLAAVVDALSEQFSAPALELEQDVVGLVTELVHRGMLMEVTHG
jgi:hypothetical protein